MGRNPMKPCCLLLVLTCSLVASRRGTFVSTSGSFAMSAGSNRAGNDEEEYQLDHAELIDELGDEGDTEFDATRLSKLYPTDGPISSWIYQRNASNQDGIDLCLNTTSDEDPCTSNVVMRDGATEMVVKLATNKWIEGCTSGWQTEDFKIVSQDGVCSTVRQYGTGSEIAKLYNPSAEPMKSLISRSSLTTVWFVPTATFIKVTDREFNVTAQSQNRATSIHQGKLSYTKLTHCVALVYQLWNHSKVVEHPYEGETFKGACGDTTWSHLNQNKQKKTIKHCTYQKRMVSDCATAKSLEVTACRAHKKHNKQDWTPI